MRCNGNRSGDEGRDENRGQGRGQACLCCANRGCTSLLRAVLELKEGATINQPHAMKYHNLLSHSTGHGSTLWEGLYEFDSRYPRDAQKHTGRLANDMIRQLKVSEGQSSLSPTICATRLS